MAEDDRDRYVVAAVTSHQPPIVVQWAARLARHFDAVLVCAHVEADHYVVKEIPTGRWSLDRSTLTWRTGDTAVFDSGLAVRIRIVAGDAGVPVEFRELAGGIGHAMARLAEVLDAEMIVVGSRRGGGMRTSMHEFFGGSVAVHLAHRQPRPLVVIPLSPKPQGRLPWDQHHP